MKATWNDTVLAESSDTVVVENNHYFPIEAINKDYLRPSEHHSICPWKGTASYYDIVVNGRVNENAVCVITPDPMDEAKQIRGRVAFWKGVKVVRCSIEHH